MRISASVWTALILSFAPAAGIAPQISSLAGARQALGAGQFTSAIVEFEYTGIIQGDITKGKTIRYDGHGKLVYAHPGKYRLELLDSGGVNPALRVAVDDGRQYSRWRVVGDKAQPATLDAAAASAGRRKLEREVMVYLSALLLADTSFMKYEPLGAQGDYTVTGTGGGSAELMIRNGRVEEIRYVRTRLAAIAITAGGPASAPPEATQPARARISDFRTMGSGMLPYRFHADYDQGSEDVSVTRYVLNTPIPDGQFQPPAAGRE